MGTWASWLSTSLHPQPGRRCAAPELGTHTPGPLVLQQYSGQHFKHLVHALNPAIFGQELTKAAIILALMGGVRKHVGHASKVPIRGDIHVLLVGDPGLGKSQLLQVSWEARLSRCKLLLARTGILHAGPNRFIEMAGGLADCGRFGQVFAAAVEAV